MKILKAWDYFAKVIPICTVASIFVSTVLPFYPMAFAQSAPTYAPGELLVKLNPQVTAPMMQEVLNRTQTRVLERLDQIGWMRLQLAPGQTVEMMAAHLRQFPQIQFAEPNYIVQAIGIPNDPEFRRLWGLHNTGQTGGTNGADIDAPEGWDNFTAAGNTVTVAVIDTGIDYNHPDLSARMWTNTKETAGNGVDDDGNGFVDDIRGWDFVSNDNNPADDNNHGTHVAGTIGAAFNNGTGVAGVAGPANVKLMALKFLNSRGSGLTSNAVKSLDYATKNGAVISNNSWGGGSYSQALADAIQRNHQAGRLFVAAAGNNSANTDTSAYYPQGYNVANVISVASTTASDGLSSFSNFGAQSVDLGAPGSSIYSTVRGGYATYSGTSMATPHVVGAAAAIWAKNPNLTNTQVKQILLDNTRKIAALNGKTVTGGVLNLKNALAATSGPGGGTPPPNPTPTPTPSPSPIPATPSELVGQGLLDQRSYFAIRYARLTWKDNATNESNYEVWRSTAPDSGFSKISTLGANVTTFTQALGYFPLRSDYYYRVRATNNAGASAFSNTVKINRF